MSTPNRAKVLQLIDLCCQSAKSGQLKSISFLIGAANGTTKELKRTYIQKQCEFLEQLRQQKMRHGKISILSMDAGVSNFAFSKMQLSNNNPLPKVLDWQKLNLEEKFFQNLKKMNLNPNETSQLVFDLTEYLFKSEPIPDMFTIERQRARTMSSRYILEPILKVNILEQILFSNLENKVRYTNKTQNASKLRYVVRSSDPHRMTSYWCIPKEETLTGSKKSKSNKYSKDLRIKLVKKIVSSSVFNSEPKNPTKLVEFSDIWGDRIRNALNEKKSFKLYDILEIQDNFGVKKDDDLADSFLHSLSWIEWVKNYETIAELLSSTSLFKMQCQEVFEFCENKIQGLEYLQNAYNSN
ncbi:cce1p [Saccharomyces arboricola H-6]|uniref:Cruciform cutting endonuclease 1, mitochondrial n=1 Tax=Saccharomyces arboricola (strain H-6 / AS 2.3317 / CBS 10644) TaxID=1160507 RepID=J8Q5M9_SACAR|nr:cce1p [Saccharomyces arboricola H-6]